MRKLDLIDFIPESEGKAQIKVFQGRRVIVDDTLPVRAGTTSGLVYTSYLFGPGAFAKGAAPLDSTPLQGGIGTAGVEIARQLDSQGLKVARRTVTKYRQLLRIEPAERRRGQLSSRA